MKLKVHDELKKHFRPEFLNRIDDIIVFHQLSQNEIIQMVDLMIGRVEAQLKNKDMDIALTEQAKSLLAKRGFDPVLGARPLRRTIQRETRSRTSCRRRSSSTNGPGPDRPGRRRGLGRRGRRREREVTFHGSPKPVKVPDSPAEALAGAGDSTPSDGGSAE